MRRSVIGALLVLSLAFVLFVYFLIGYASVRQSAGALSPDGRYMAKIVRPVPLFNWVAYSRQRFTLQIRDLNLRTVRTFSFKAQEPGRSASFSWSEGETPCFALQYGSDDEKIFVYCSKDGTAKNFDVAKRLSSISGPAVRPIWSPDGRTLFLQSSNENGSSYWRAGMDRPEAIGFPPAGQVPRGNCWLSATEILLSTKEGRGTSRFYRLVFGDRPELTDATNEFPSLQWVRGIGHRDSTPDLFLVSQMAGIGKEGSWNLLLVSLDRKAVLKTWERARGFFSENGRFVYVRGDDSRTGTGSFRRVSLPDLSETVLCPATEGWREYLVHPEDKWYGSCTGLFKRTPLGRIYRQELRDNGLFKVAPFTLVRDVGWIGGPGHWRLGIIRKGFVNTRLSLLDPLTGKVEDLPQVYVWSMLLAPQMSVFWVSLFGIVLNAILFVVLYFGRSASEGARPLGWLFWALSNASAVLVLPAVMLAREQDWTLAPWGAAVSWLLALLFVPIIAGFTMVPYATLRFATEFPTPNAYRDRFPKLVHWSKIVTVALPVLSLTSVGLVFLQNYLFDVWNPTIPEEGVRKAQKGVEAVGAILGPVVTSAAIVGFVLVILSIAAVVHNFRFAPSERVKGQLRYIALGFSAPLIWGFLAPALFALASMLFPSAFEDSTLFPLVFLGGITALPALFCGYALLSSELLDLSFVIRRTVKYTALLVILGIVFFGLVAGLGILLPSAFGARSEVSVALASVASVVVFQPVRRRVQDWVDIRFDRARFDAKQTLSELSSRFSTMGSLPEIVKTLETAAQDILRVSESRVVFFKGGRVSFESPSSAEALEPSDVSGLDPKEITSLLSVDLPWVKMAVPIAHHDRAFAVLALGEKLSQEKYSPEDREFIRILADGAGLAFQNLTLVKEAARAEIYHRDLEAAREVQARYFPKQLPSIPGFDVAAFNEPARIVGGDYYDVIPLQGGLFAFAIADVSGKGMPAALRVAEVRSYLHASIARGPDPGASLTEMNRYLCLSGHENEFTTMFLSILNPETNVLAYACAGHVPPLLRNDNGAVISLVKHSALPVGIDSSEAYPTENVALLPGAVLVMMSDGLPERKDPEGRLLGFDALEKALQAVDSGFSPGKVISTLMGLGDGFARGTQAEDDVTVVVVQRLS